MRDDESASVLRPEARGLLWGALGVLAFSLTLVAARAADPAFGALTVGAARAVVAAALALVVLVRRGEPMLPRTDRRAFLLVAGTVVLGFPLLTAYALEDVSSAHAAVGVGLAPAATAGFAVLVAGEKPSRGYWLALSVGMAAVVVFAIAQGAGTFQTGDLLVLIAVGVVGLGYSQGGVLSRRYDGGTVICWALIMSLPITVPLTTFGLLAHPPDHVTLSATLGLGYLAVFSAFLGFFAWYRGLALGGVARVARLQVMQPVLTLIWADLLLGEKLTLLGMLAAIIVLASTAVGRRVTTATESPVPSTAESVAHG